MGAFWGAQTLPCGSTPHLSNETRQRYQAARVPFGSNCQREDQTRTCKNGQFTNWTGSFAQTACTVDGALSCGATPHNGTESRTMYQAASVAYNQTCAAQTQTRTCSNGSFGAWTGSYTFSSCAPAAPLACGSTPHNGSETRIRYQSASVPFGQTCVQETQNRTCTNGAFGNWSGSYTQTSCAPAAASSCGTTPHGSSESRTRYLTSSVAFGQSCAMETQNRVCTNGTFGNWSGSYTFATCAPAAALSCGTTPHNQVETRIRYQTQNVPYGQTCVQESQSRLCTNGTFANWSGSYTFTTCSPNAPLACGATPHDGSETRTRYKLELPSSEVGCEGETQSRICSNGSFGNWSGSFTFVNCTPQSGGFKAVNMTGAYARNRQNETLVWSGKEVLMTGGAYLSGGRFFIMDSNHRHAYNPATDTWRALGPNSAGIGRMRQDTSLWIDKYLVAFSYDTNPSRHAYYNPDTDLKIDMSATGVPSPRSLASVVHQGTKMILYGGMFQDVRTFYHYKDGGIFDTATNKWVPFSHPTNARFDHIAVMAGGEMIVWGGSYYTVGNDILGNTVYKSTPILNGERWNSVTNRWTYLPSENAPKENSSGKLFYGWNGSKFVVWDGTSGSVWNSATNAWTVIPLDNAPIYHKRKVGIWTGKTLVMFTNELGNDNYAREAAEFDPETMRWRRIDMSGLPQNFIVSDGVWANDQAFLFGVKDTWTEWDSAPAAYMFKLGNYLPDKVKPTVPVVVQSVTKTGAPNNSNLELVSKSGDKPFFHGGSYPISSTRSSPAKALRHLYNSATDTWEQIAEAPNTISSNSGKVGASERYIMVFSSGASSNAVYDKTTGAWTSVSIAGAPAPRVGASIVWTGSEFIVWAGSDSAGNPLTDGAIYNPASKTWRGMSVPAAMPRKNHLAQWTGAEMLVWGGESSTGVVDAGWRYNVISNTWAPMVSANAPTNKSKFVYDWNGSKLVVWGGRQAEGPTDGNYIAGSIYDPVLNMWTPISSVNAPIYHHKDVGGFYNGKFLVLNHGPAGYEVGALDLNTNAWIRYDVSSIPFFELDHFGVSTPQGLMFYESLSNQPFNAKLLRVP